MYCVDSSYQQEMGYVGKISKSGYIDTKSKRLVKHQILWIDNASELERTVKGLSKQPFFVQTTSLDRGAIPAPLSSFKSGLSTCVSMSDNVTNNWSKRIARCTVGDDLEQMMLQMRVASSFH